SFRARVADTWSEAKGPFRGRRCEKSPSRDERDFSAQTTRLEMTGTPVPRIETGTQTDIYTTDKSVLK
ncbi:MAG TPA: hypothetical protein VIX58_08180, partial [Anaerolineae bacterium]